MSRTVVRKCPFTWILGCFNYEKAKQNYFSDYLFTEKKINYVFEVRYLCEVLNLKLRSLAFRQWSRTKDSSDKFLPVNSTRDLYPGRMYYENFKIVSRALTGVVFAFESFLQRISHLLNYYFARLSTNRLRIFWKIFCTMNFISLSHFVCFLDFLGKYFFGKIPTIFQSLISVFTVFKWYFAFFVIGKIIAKNFLLLWKNDGWRKSHCWITIGDNEWFISLETDSEIGNSIGYKFPNIGSHQSVK